MDYQKRLKPARFTDNGAAGLAACRTGAALLRFLADGVETSTVRVNKFV